MNNRREHGTRAGTVVDVRDGMASVLLDGAGEATCRMDVPCEAGDRVAVAVAHEPSISTSEGGE